MNRKIQTVLFVALHWLMAAMFIESFIDKIMHWQHYIAETSNKGIPMPHLALLCAALTELIGSATLLTGRYVRFGAALLAFYVFVLGFFYFDFWNLPDPQSVFARKDFLKDMSIVSGLLIMALSPQPNRRSI